MAWRRWQDWVNVVAGVWLIASPWILGVASNSAAQWAFVVLGIATVVFALAALAVPGSLTAEILTTAVGVVTFFAPWLFGFAGLVAGRWNAWILGAVVVIVSLLAIAVVRQHGPTAGHKASV